MADEGEIRFVGDLQILRMQPGDVGVIKVRMRLTAIQVARIREAWRERFPSNEVLILDDGMEVGVLQVDQETGQDASDHRDG